MDRFSRQIEFILELDKLKRVQRRTYLTDASRWENTAEHSWHVSLAAFVLAEHADEKPDIGRVLRMLLVHDVVEIDADDTFCYDEDGVVGQTEREQAAADRLFALLPDDQAEEFRALWEEFEAGNTPEARFARTLDRLQPLLQNFASQGRSWRENRISKDQVLLRVSDSPEASGRIQNHFRFLIDAAVGKGYLNP